MSGLFLYCEPLYRPSRFANPIKAVMDIEAVVDEEAATKEATMDEETVTTVEEDATTAEEAVTQEAADGLESVIANARVTFSRVGNAAGTTAELQLFCKR